MDRFITLAILFSFIIVVGRENLQATTSDATNATVKAAIDVRALMTEGEEAYERNDFLTAIRRFIEAEKHLDGTDDALLLTELYYDLGASFFQISAHGQSLDYFYRALKLCPKGELGDELRNNINYGIAGVYFKDADYKKAEDLLLPFYKDALEANDTASIIYTTGFLSMLARRQNDQKGALEMIETAKNYLTDKSPYDEG